jgi:hypothetical protein
LSALAVKVKKPTAVYKENSTVFMADRMAIPRI